MDTSDEKQKAKLLDYVRVLRNKHQQQSERQGITIWAVLVAMIYIVWKSLPNLSPILNSPLQTEILLSQFGFSYSSIILAVIIFSGFTRQRPLTRNDYRVEDLRHVMSISQFIIFMCFFILLPALLNLNTYLLSETNFYIKGEYSLATSRLFFILLLLITLGVAIQYGHLLIKGYPLPSVRVAKNSVLGIFMGIATYCLFITFLYLNTAEFIRGLMVNVENTNIIAETALNISLLVFGVNLLFSMRHSSEKTLRLNNLERDIIMHEISNKEIKSRLEQSFLGYQFGEWIENKIQNVKAKSEKLIGFTDGVESFIEDYEKIDRDYTEERKKRFGNMLNEFESNLDEFHIEVKAITNWFGALLKNKTVSNDPVIKEISEKLLQEIEDINSKTTASGKNAILKLKAVKH